MLLCLCQTRGGLADGELKCGHCKYVLHWQVSTAPESFFVCLQVVRTELANFVIDVHHDTQLNALVLQHLSSCCTLASCTTALGAVVSAPACLCSKVASDLLSQPPEMNLTCIASRDTMHQSMCMPILEHNRHGHDKLIPRMANVAHLHI